MSFRKDYNYQNWNPEKHFDYEMIGICPKCGRVGKFDYQCTGQEKDRKIWIHKEHIIEGNGVHNTYLDDYCVIEQPEYV